MMNARSPSLNGPRRTVGTLDESFVVGWVHTEAVFITKGQLWRVLN